MKLRRASMWVSAGVVVLGLLGCSVSVRRSHRPTVYEDEPQYVIVREAPPPIVRERRPPPPSRGYIWIDGYWNWDGHRYVWEPGHWAAPPHGRAVWVAPRYERHGDGYRYLPGRWRVEQEEGQREGEPQRDRH
jgi:hypothetical protein